jgi:hypothetical protein
MKHEYLKAFNIQLTELLEEILKIFPGHIDIIALKNTMSTIRRANPSILIKAWHTYVFTPYADKIYNGDIDYFLNKDYANDTRNLDSSKQTRAIESINMIKGPIKEMNNENKIISMQYISNITKLSNLYKDCS